MSQRPRILAIDCATLPASVAVVHPAGEPRELVQHDDTRTDAWIGEAVPRCLEAAGIAMQQLDGLACTVGPGTFTGIRVGIATALGLAAPRELPVAGIRTLDALALLGFQRATAVAACIDARRGQVYAALYERDTAGGALPLASVWGPAVCAPQELAAARAEHSASALLIGSGAAALSAAGGESPLAAAVGRLALRAWAAGDAAPTGWPPPQPFYLRPPDAMPPQNPLLRARR